MTDLVVWLRQQLDTDERTARTNLGSAEDQALALVSPDYNEGFIVEILRLQLRQVQAHRAILDALEAAEARQKVEWRNYQRWIDGKPDKPVPDGPREDVIAGLKLAVKFLVSIYSDRDGHKEEWSA